MSDDIRVLLSEENDRLTDAVAKQAARIEALEAALRPFADESLWCGPQHEFVTVKRSDCDTARAALEESSDD